MGRMWVCAAIIALLTVFTGPARAGVPTDKIRETTNEILAVVSDPLLKDPARAAERKRLIRAAVDKRFDWTEMARRSLARNWSGRTEEERKAFVDLFGQLLERTYLDKVEGYSGEKVLYQDEGIDGDYSEVKVQIVTDKNEEIGVVYRLRKKGIDWLVYDISIAGVSLVNNYRVQFNSILARSSFQDLITRLKEKVRE